MKMEKTPRYTQRERNMVLGFAAQYKEVIENKRTDAESNRKKDEVWRQIAKEFNCRVYHQRSSKQLRQLYKNMKLLLKKDLCGGAGIGSASSVVGNGIGNGNSESKSHRSFMDILNALSQQDSVAQYISEQLSPSGYSSSRQQKFDDDFDESKLPSAAYDGLDNDVIVIKSEDISDNEHSSQNGAGCGDDMDDDDDDCLSPKDIPEVCLEEEDDEIFATDLRQPSTQQQHQSLHQQQTAQQQQTGQQPQQPEITIQNIGGIRVGSIGSIANLANAAKTLLAASNSNNNSHNNNNTTTTNSSSSNNNSALNISLSTTSNNCATTSAEQQQREQQQQLLFSGLGLSAVHAVNQQQLPTLQHATQRTTTHNNNNNHHVNGLLALNSNSHYQQQHNHKSSSSHNNHHHNNNKSAHNSNDYLMSLAIEERKRKIDLLNAQIEYWKTLTKKLDANSGHNPTPSCLCHFPPAKLNGLQSQQSSS